MAWEVVAETCGVGGLLRWALAGAADCCWCGWRTSGAADCFYDVGEKPLKARNTPGKESTTHTQTSI